MRRTFDVEEINRLLDRDFPGADLAEAVANPLNVCLVEGANGAIFAWRGPGTYEIHLLYEARGREALALFDAMLGLVQSAYGGHRFWALVPMESRNVRMFARLAGFLSDGVLDTAHGPNELFVSETCGCLLDS